MTVGTVKWFNDAKGFGFLEPEGGGEDVFAHFSAIQMEGFRTLQQGEQVEYELVQGPKGRLAQNIRAVRSPTAAAASQPLDEGDLEDVEARERVTAPESIAGAL